MVGFADREQESTDINWGRSAGRAAAGLGIASGVVLAGVGLDIPILKEVGETAGELFTGGAEEGAENAANEALSTTEQVIEPVADIKTPLTDRLTDPATLGGAALTATGAAYLATHPAKEQQHYDPIAEAQLQAQPMGFAAKEEMRKVDALMKARAAAFGGQTPAPQGPAIG